MADNFPLTPGTGRNAATDQITYSGDEADVQLVKSVFVNGVEGSKTATGHSAGAGAVDGGTPRTTLANDDPAVVALAAILAKLLASVAVTGTFFQATQPVSASALPLPTGASTEATLSMLNGKVPAQGQALAAASWPVVLPTTQITSLTPPAAITGFALEAGHLAAIDTSTAKIPSQGQALAAGSMPVVLTAIQLASLTAPVLAAGEAHIGQVGGQITNPSANFTRPADTTAYAVGDLVANSTTAGSVAPLSWSVTRTANGSFRIRGARLKKTSTVLTNASFRLHLFAATQTVTNGDNGAIVPSTAADYLGSFDVTASLTFADGSAGVGIPSNGGDRLIKLASGQTIYGIMEARAAYTPTSGEVFTWILEVDQD